MIERTSDRNEPCRYITYIRMSAVKNNDRTLNEQVQYCLNRLRNSGGWLRFPGKDTKRQLENGQTRLQQLLRDIRSAKVKFDVIVSPTSARISRND